MSIKKYIDNAIKTIDATIQKLEEQKEWLNSLNAASIDDETLAALKTPDMIRLTIKNMFPSAENILIYANSIYFVLHGYKIQIPMSFESINIDTSWYIADEFPSFYMFPSDEKLKNYFKAKDAGASWTELADIQYPDENKIDRYALYLKNKERLTDEIRQAYETYEKCKQERINQYYTERAEMKQKALFVQNILLPELNKFSTQHLKYNGFHQPSIDEIIKYELETDTNA